MLSTQVTSTDTVQTDITPIINEAQIENALSASDDNGSTNDHHEDGRLALIAAVNELFSHSIKFVLCRLAYIGGNVASRSILGLRDAQHLAASSLINSTQIAALNTTTGAMFVMGVYTRGAIAERRLSDIGILYRKGIVMSLCLGVPALLFTRFTGSLFNLARQPHDVTDIIDQHNSLYCFAIPASILLMQNMQLLSATDNYSAMAVHSAFYSALLVPLSYGLMNGYGPLPQLDAQGVGLANLIASWVSVLTTTLYLFCSNRYRPHQFLNARSAENSEPSVLKLLREGLPIGMQIGLETFYVVVLTELIGLISQDDLSASVPAWHTTSILTVIIFGLAHVSGVLARHAVGEGRFQDARQYGYASLMVGSLIPIAALSLFFAAPDRIVSLFIDADAVGNDQILDKAKLFLSVAVMSLIPDAIRNVSSGALRAYNDTAFAMLSSMFSIAAVGMLASVFLGFKSSLGSLGVFLGRALAFTVSALVMFSYWHRKSHAVTDEISLNTERERTLRKNIQVWLNELLCSPFRQMNILRNRQPSEINDEQPLINRIQRLYGSLLNINPFDHNRNGTGNLDVDNRLDPSLSA